MEMNNIEELKAHLIETSDEFRRLAHQHSEYARKIDTLEAQPYLSEQDQLEEIRLKKLKLHMKDQMMEFMNRYRAQQTA